MYKASCHCGAIQLEVAELPISLTECNCSICHRIGALWAYYKQSQVKIVFSPEALSRYIWGERRIEFCSCKVCGCTTHYESIENGGDKHMAVNARSIAPTELQGIPIRKFDGADSWKYLDD
jgi:hypothetical protein